MLDNPKENLYLAQIARETKLANSTVQHVLEKQLGDEYLAKEKVGNLSYYRLKTGSSLVKQAKIARTFEEIAGLIDSLQEISKKIVLFGSCARGEDTGQSDIDLFVLSNKKKEAEEIISRVKTRRKVRTIIKTYPEWVVLKEKKRYLYDEIDKGQAISGQTYG